MIDIGRKQSTKGAKGIAPQNHRQFVYELFRVHDPFERSSFEQRLFEYPDASCGNQRWNGSGPPRLPPE